VDFLSEFAMVLQVGNFARAESTDPVVEAATEHGQVRSRKSPQCFQFLGGELQAGENACGAGVLEEPAAEFLVREEATQGLLDRVLAHRNLRGGRVFSGCFTAHLARPVILPVYDGILLPTTGLAQVCGVVCKQAGSMPNSTDGGKPWKIHECENRARAFEDWPVYPQTGGLYIPTHTDSEQTPAEY
jgi:hypothetical protein